MKRPTLPIPACRARRISRALGMWAARFCAIVAFCAGMAQAGPYDTWGKYKAITINTTSGTNGANVSSTITNFPVLIRLDDDYNDDILDEALAGGADVRFTNADGSTALAYQIERWSSTAAEIWVLVPSIAGNTITDIRIYWKKSGQTDASSGSSVFATSNSFAGVWHLGETGNSTADGYKDATGNAAHAQGSNFGAGNEATAVAGKGQTFAYASSRKITVKAAEESNFDITGAITVSAWINISSWNANWQSILTKGDNAWRLARDNGTGKLNFTCSGLTGLSIIGNTTVTTGGSTWYHVTGVYDGSNLRMYLNGSSDATAVAATGSTTTNNYNVMIGENEQTTGRFFNGIIDEARVENTARSADWIKLSYQNQKPNATCISFGPTLATIYYWNRNTVITSSTDFSKAYNWTSNADGTGRRPVTADDDDFTDNALNAAWTIYDNDGYGDSPNPWYSLTDVPDNLSLRAKGSDVDGAVIQLEAAYRTDITGNFDVSVKVLSQTNTDNWAKGGIMMADNFGTWSNGGMAAVSVTPGNGFQFQYDNAGTVGELSAYTIAGSATYPCWLRLVKNGSSVSAFYRTATASAWTQIGSATTIQSTSANSQIGLFVTAHNTTNLSTVVFDDFQAGIAFSATDLDLSFAGSGSGADANATLSANQAAASIDFTGYTGTFNFGSSTLTINSGNATFVSGMTVTAGTGTLAFTGNSGTQTFTPKSGATFPAITSTGASGTVAVAGNALTAGDFTLNSGTWQWGSGFTHTVASISTAAGTMDFGSSTVRVGSGNANLSNLGSVVAGTGSLSFTGTSGTQVLTPPSALTLPAVTSTGASTLQLSTNTLSCASYSQSAGVLDFNSQNITTTGDFTVSVGTSSSFSNLNGRTLTVGGNASLAGQSGNLLNLSAAAWTITVTGSLTAEYATVGGSNASGGSRGMPANCVNAGGNTNWAFIVATTLSNLSRSMRINFNTSAIGVTGNVANVPLLVRLNASNFTFSGTTEDGLDVLFVDKDGTTLYHQVAEWDKANKTGKVWVRVPQVDGSSTTDYMTLYYGCDSCVTNGYAVSDSVFTAFKSVFHLNAPEDKAYDAALLKNHGTYYRNQPNAAGITGKNAVFFDGQDSSAVNVPVEANYDITTNLSVWAWIKVNSFTKASQAIVTKGDNAFRLSRNASTNTLYFAGSKSSTTYAATGSVNVNDGGWHHVVGTYDGANVKLYVDGAQDGSSTALTGSLDNGAYNLYIGENAQQLGRTFNGSISEVRIGNSAAVLSSDFIKLSYQNQKENSAFYTFYTTESFQSAKVFKLNTTPSGADVTGDVTNFPLLLRITGSTIVDGVQGTGATAPADIRFLDGDGVTWLDYQVERWDRALDSAEVWVRVPRVEGNYAGHGITMYYKQAAGVTVVDGQCASCVFSASNGFAGVWHLGEEQSGTGTAALYKDAGESGFNGSDYISATLQNGIVGSGHDFDGVNDYITLAAGSNFLPSASTNLTASAWFKADSYTATTDGNRILSLPKTDSSSAFLFSVSGLGGSNRIDYWGGVGSVYRSKTNLSTGVWTHAALTWDGSSFRVYVNGSLDTVQAGSISAGTSANARIGIRTLDILRPFDGHLDEIRFEQVARSPDWVKLAYQNQRNDASPLFNPSPADFVSTQKYTFNTTRTGANVGGNVANFPLLVRITGSAIVDAVQNNAPDIRFLDGDGATWLNYHIERWDKTLDSAEVWVMVPQVDGNSDRDFFTLYYNDVSNGTVPNGQCASCVFPRSNGYLGVWHLGDASGTASRPNSVSSGTNDAAPKYNGSPLNLAPITGYIGKADTIRGNGTGMGTIGDHFDIGSLAAGSFPAGTLTFSMWAKPTSFGSNNFVHLLSVGNTTSNGGDNEIWMGRRGSTDSTLSGQVMAGLSSTNRFDGAAGTINTGSWQHFALTVNGTNDTLYRNGSYVASLSSGNTVRDTIRSMNYLGRSAWTADSTFKAVLDEVRISNVARSSDWVKLEYETQRRTGNLFWNNRAGPNNKAALTAVASSASTISLSWPSSVTDSSNADSVAIWVRFSDYPDSVGAAATLVARLAKSDTTYQYPATYPATYYFSLAVRNASGQWSPFTSTSSDTATLSGITMPDTVYVDGTTGSSSNNCTAARNPSTPKKTVKDALTCGAAATDTLVVRVMPGVYTDSAFAITTKPSIVSSFDNNTRAVFSGSGTATLDGGARTWTLLLYASMGIRNLDVRCGTNGYSGVYVTNAANVFVEGCRIYNNGGTRHGTGIEARGGGNFHHYANNLIHQPSSYGMMTTDDNSFNVVNNVFVGPASGSGTGFWMNAAASAADMTLANNVFYNWNYGLTSTTANIGSCAGNLFFGVTTGQNTATTTCTGSVTGDPLFANTTPSHPQAFKLLPGSPAIDAGSTAYGAGAQAATRRTPTDFFGTARPAGAAPDIGLYEGPGYAPGPSGEFDTLRVSSTATTATVQNSKWRLVWDKARGAGITGFYDKTTDSTSNLVYTNSLLFDAKIGSLTASSQTGVGPLLYLQESTRVRAVVRQNLPVSASVDLNIYYTVYASGHVYIESELANLSAGASAVTTVDYTLRLGTASGAFTSAGTKSGFGYLTAATRDAALSVTRDLDGGASGAETWSTSTAASGTPATVVFKTADLADLAQNTVRRHDFLLYLGDNALDFGKAAALNADAYGPSALTMTAGSLLSERSWQDALQGHWTLDDGAGATARDKSVFVQNNAALAGANYKWVPGRVNGGLYLTATDSAYVASSAVLNPSNGFTVMFWLKPDFTGMGDTALIVSKGLSNANGWYCRKVANASGTNKILFNMGGTTVTSPSLTDLAWSHIAVVADAGGNRNLEMYVNGVQVSASTAAALAAPNALNLVMGYASGAIGAAKFKGTLDDVRVYGRETAGSDIQSIYSRGFSSRFGQYALRADNNNRAIALINADTAKTRMQPAFYVSNWYGPPTPNFVYLNGVRLTPNVDFVSDTVVTSVTTSGSYLALQLNKILTGADQTLFIDDDDSSGFMGTATAMKTLTISSAAGDKIAVRNFSDTVFAGANSGQWYMELDLNGWTTPARTSLTDTGFGEINVWKAAAVSPNVAVSSAYQMVGWGSKTGRGLSYMRLDATGSNEVFTAGSGYSGTAGISYTLTDSSSTRLSLTLTGMTLSQGGTVASVSKRFTFYPTGRVFVSYEVTGATINMDAPRLDLNPRYDGLSTSAVWSNTVARDSARQAFIGGSANFHSIGLAMLGVKNNAGNYATGATMLGSAATSGLSGSDNDQRMAQFNMPTSIWTSANKPVTVNFMMDFSKDFADSATADSLLRDAQRPAVLAAITGSRVTSDALDFNADNFAEGDGAYTYAASSGIAHFRFVNAAASFNPAFRIGSWTQGVLPEFVILDNQVLAKGYHYNAYLNTASNELIMQFNKTLAPGAHVFYVSHKSGLAVTLRAFTAAGGDGVDTLAWTTESEFENLGFNLWRRPAPGEAIDSLAAGLRAAGDSAAGAPSADTLPSVNLTPQELAAMGYVRVNAKLITGAQGGSSASTLDYRYLDRTVAFGTAHEYLLEAVDFNGVKVQYGPRTARPGNPLATELQGNYPNPFNPTTTLRFSLKEKLKVSLIIYDSRGRLVRTLMRGDKTMPPGKHRLVWDARTDGGFEAPSGQYFYRFTAGRYVKTRKMILVK